MTTAPEAIDVVQHGAADQVERARPLAPWFLAGGADAVALALLLTRSGTTPALAALGLHLLALLPFAVRSGLTNSERLLGAAFVFGLPVVGAPLAALAVRTEGQGEVLATPDDEPMFATDGPRADELRRMGEALPCCEALLAGQVEERRAIIATLTRRADADAVALLRWALGAPDPELAVDAALALEEMAASFEADLAAARAALAAAPTGAGDRGAAEAALALAELVTDAVDSGIADPALVGTLAHEARAAFERAGDGSSARLVAVAHGRVRLELAVLRPDTALACLDEALDKVDPADRPALAALREEAVLASHALPWEGPSALATYMHAPAITARRRYGSVARGTHRGITRGTGNLARGTGNIPRGTGAGIAVGPVQIPAPATTRQPPLPPADQKEEGDER
jgi:hypothetical protein